MSNPTDHWLRQYSQEPNSSLGQIGAVGQLDTAQILKALRSPQVGTIYDLDAGRWLGMAVHPVHPPFTITTYRTPRGMQVDNGPRQTDDSFTSELIISSMHAGAHIDSLCHVTCGPDNAWHQGRREADELGDIGAKSFDGAALPPFICRGVLIDIPPVLDVECLDAGHGIDWKQTQRALKRQKVEIQRGDAVFFRTGFMKWWLTDPALSRQHAGAGITLDVAERLAKAGVVLAGSDTEGFEQLPSPDPERYLPVHVELLINHGIHIIELAYLDDLARDEVYEFLLICLPLRIVGATGSMVRPIAVI